MVWLARCNYEAGQLLQEAAAAASMYCDKDLLWQPQPLPEPLPQPQAARRRQAPLEPQPEARPAGPRGELGRRRRRQQDVVGPKQEQEKPPQRQELPQQQLPRQRSRDAPSGAPPAPASPEALATSQLQAQLLQPQQEQQGQQLTQQQPVWRLQQGDAEPMPWPLAPMSCGSRSRPGDSAVCDGDGSDVAPAESQPVPLPAPPVAPPSAPPSMRWAWRGSAAGDPAVPSAESAPGAAGGAKPCHSKAGSGHFPRPSHHDAMSAAVAVAAAAADRCGSLYVYSRVFMLRTHRHLGRDLHASCSRWYIAPNVASRHHAARGAGGATASVSTPTAVPLSPLQRLRLRLGPQSHEAELARAVQNMLNRVCPDNLDRIVEQFGNLAIRGPEDLESMISLIIRKVVDEPIYGGTYADLVYSLRERYPQFPAETEGVPPTSFTRVLLNAVQTEFEAMHSAAATRAGGDHLQDIQRKRALANMQFIGHLFLRGLLRLRVISWIADELLTDAEELGVECVCQLVQGIGYTLDTTSDGARDLLEELMQRLAGMSQAFSKRLGYKIQNLLDLQAQAWQQKVLREPATTKEEIRRDAEKEPQDALAIRTAGVRPDYIARSLDDIGPGTAPAQEARPPQPPRASVAAVPAVASPARSLRPTPAVAVAVVPTAVPAVAAVVPPSAPLPRRAPEPPPSPLKGEGLRQLLARYAEACAKEQDPEPFVREWLNARSSEEEGALRHLLEFGCNGKEEQQEACAQFIAALVARGALPWGSLRTALVPLLGRLEDLRLGAPCADSFFEHLLARLLLGCHVMAFNPVILEDGKFTWSLLLGALKRVQAYGSPELVHWAVGRKELSAALRTAGQCTRRQLARTLFDEGLVTKEQKGDSKYGESSRRQ